MAERSSRQRCRSACQAKLKHATSGWRKSPLARRVAPTSRGGDVITEDRNCLRRIRHRTALLGALVALGLAACGTDEEEPPRASGEAGSAAAVPEEAEARQTVAAITECPSANRLTQFVSFVTSRGPANTPTEGAEAQPEVTLACRYMGGDASLLSFYVADFGDQADAEFAELSLPLKTAPDDDKPESREFDKVIDEEETVALVDVNYIGDLSVDGTQYVSGLSGVVRNGSFICAVPLLGSAANGQDGAALRDNVDGMVELLRFACGKSG